MRRRYHHGDLRAAMLVAAELVLERHGLDGLTLRAAAREAGVSHAAPAHHFGDLAGLLSVLAASGFDRFRADLVAADEAAGPDPTARLAASCTAYVAFARRTPGLFELMFRSGRLDWSVPALQEAAGAAFRLLLTEAEAEADDRPAGGETVGVERLALGLARWSMAHGAAMLSLDGRLEAFALQEGVAIEALMAAIARLVPPPER